MAKNNKMPAIRFSGYTDAWEQRKLGDIATITGGGTPSTNISEYWNGDIDWYSPVEIGEKRYASGSIRKITKLGLEKSSAKILPVGTVLFTSRAGIGNTAILQVEGCTNQGFQSITPNSKELDTYFLYTMTPKLKRYGEVTGAGSTFVEVSGKQMEQMNLMIPSLDEQKHVSQLFKVMDDAITLHQRKLGKLKLTKTALLQKLFPQNGSKFPELRFQGFTDAWEQRKLGDLMEVTSVKRIHQADWTDSGIRFFRARDIVSSMNNEEIDNPVFISEDKYEEYSRVSGKVVEGDLLVTGVGTIGVPYLIKDTTPLYFKDGNIIWFKNNNTLNGRYFYYCFQNGHIQNQIYSASGKGTVGTYTIENGKKTSIFYPSLNEQIKIGNLLDTMTIIITLHQRKLEMLKNVKKGLLQKMFV